MRRFREGQRLPAQHLEYDKLIGVGIADRLWCGPPQAEGKAADEQADAKRDEHRDIAASAARPLDLRERRVFGSDEEMLDVTDARDRGKTGWLCAALTRLFEPAPDHRRWSAMCIPYAALAGKIVGPGSEI
jgi:hypothetical protein